MAGEINRRLQEIQSELSQETITNEAYDHFVSITPVDKGNARRNTKKHNGEIHADYKYAKRLDTGWSDQAPDGMTGPTIKYIQEYIRKTGK